MSTLRWLALSCGVILADCAVQLLAQGADGARPHSGPPATVHLTSEQDHQRMMALLHITALRRGAEGDPKSPYAANYDESRANP